jgi:hypothetical protein
VVSGSARWIAVVGEGRAVAWRRASSGSRGAWPRDSIGVGLCGPRAGRLARCTEKRGRKELGRGLGLGPRPIKEIGKRFF